MTLEPFHRFAYLHSMTSTRIVGPQQLRDAYRQTLDRIGEAATRADRSSDGIVMIAVTKTATPDQIRTLVEMGHKDFGENRVQQLEKRVAALNEFLARRHALGGASTREGANEEKTPDQVRWHMIGHLQRNKVKQVMPLVQLIHSIDSLRLAEELHGYGLKREEPMDVLIQVNASGEASKSGVSVPAVIHLAEQIETMVHLRLRGLMTMAPYSDNPEDSRTTFARTAEIFAEVRNIGVAGDDFNVLSMGMTNDFEVAIEEGANVLRIGRALFGEAEPEE